MTIQTPLMTAEELMNLEDEAYRHELLRGELVRYPLDSAEHGYVTANLIRLVGSYVEVHKLGVAVGRCGFKIETDPDTVIASDLAFIAQERVSEITDDYPSRAPDLVVEVLSASEWRKRSERIERWLTFGASTIWLVDLKDQTVEVVRRNGERKVFRKSDELANDILPGFQVAVAEIFN